MSMKKLLLIINPCAGQLKAKKALTDIIDVFNRADYMVITYVTAAAGDGTNAVLRYAKEVDLIVCCGGDGTFNETASGVMLSGIDVPIGYIPAGSTNDFASSLHLSGNVVQAAKDIVEGEPVQVDVGSFGGRYFTYVASFGVFTRTSYTTPQNIKNALGHAAYLLGSIQELSQLRTHRLKITLPDGTTMEDKFLFGAISNSTSVGGILTLAEEQVDMSDGKLELLLIRAPKDLKELAECVLALQKQTYHCGMITFLNTDRLHITAKPDMGWTLDGEQETGHEEVEVECLYHAIRVYRKKSDKM